MKTRTQLMILVGLVSLLVGCGTVTNKPVIRGTQSPDTFIKNGDRLIEQGRPEAAIQAYDQALRINEFSAGALSGKALAVSMVARQPKTGHGVEEWKTQVEEANALLEKAAEVASNESQRDRVNLYTIRSHTEHRKGNLDFAPNDLESRWLSPVKQAFKDISKTSTQYPAALFYMAEAYDADHQYEQAIRLLLTLKKRNDRNYDKKATESIQALYQRLMIAGDHDEIHRVAQLKTITRADLAVLLTVYFPLETLTKNRQDQQYPDYQRPVSFEPAPAKLKDVPGHPLEVNIQALIELDIRGLRLLNEAFDSDASVKRGELAMVLEDILTIALNIPKVRTQYIGSSSSYPDVPQSHPAFNAIRTVVDRNLMDVKNMQTAQFGIDTEVTGLETLQALSKLKQELRL